MFSCNIHIIYGITKQAFALQFLRYGNPFSYFSMGYENIFSFSGVLVSNSSDRTGEEDYNLQLSDNRASRVADKLKSLKENFSKVSYDAYGESVLRYNNELPEGRFYCRTVEIIVETPVRE